MESSAPPRGPAAPSQMPSISPRYKRSVRNFLIDARFQLKYTAVIVAVAVVISAVLIGFLAKTSDDVTRQAEQVAAQGERAMVESKKVSEVVRMTIKRDYAETPELAASFDQEAGEADRRLEEQQRALISQQQVIKRQQRTMLATLIAAFTLMTVALGLLGIYLTHKVAGPLYKIRMLLKQVQQGKLKFEGKLRKGDELQDLFETFSAMVESLRARQTREIQELEVAMRLAKTSGASGESITRIEMVHEEMKRALDM